MQLLTKNFKGGTSPRIYPWNQSQIENPQAPAFIRGVNLKSKISNLKSIDGYGTLIDWERGILPVLRQLLSSREIDLSDDATLERFAQFEAELEKSQDNYIKYREILQKRVQQFGKIFNFEPTETEIKCLSESIKNGSHSRIQSQLWQHSSKNTN